ncbi:uncharacterized protein DS421_10g302510 [Arachis hypogaea]|nr:uncharacterized protein DS421_10g302510 [Arachis hypogaea]
MLNWDQTVRDILKLKDPNQKMKRIGNFCTHCAHLGHGPKVCRALMENSAANKVKEDMVGEWLKVDQVGRRVEMQEEMNSTENTNADPQPRKTKTTTDVPALVLIESPADSVKENAAEGESNLAPQETWRISFQQLILSNTPGGQRRKSVLKVKHLARQGGSEHRAVVGEKRRNEGKENLLHNKVCLETNLIKNEMVEGASCQLPLGEP